MLRLFAWRWRPRVFCSVADNRACVCSSPGSLRRAEKGREEEEKGRSSAEGITHCENHAHSLLLLWWLNCFPVPGHLVKQIVFLYTPAMISLDGGWWLGGQQQQHHTNRWVRGGDHVLSGDNEMQILYSIQERMYRGIQRGSQHKSNSRKAGVCNNWKSPGGSLCLSQREIRTFLHLFSLSL